MFIKKGKVLLVDDSDVVLMTEEMMLRNLGDFEVVVARNGREALEQAKAERPDLIIMDIVMPEMDGVEACRAIRNDPATRSIPIVMVSTRSEEDRVADSYEAGCNDYVTKPIDKIELAQKIRDLI